MTTGMTMTRFVERLDRFGPDLDNWPQAEATAGRALLARSPAAAEALAEARALHDMLAALPPPVAPAALPGRILASLSAGSSVDVADRLLAWFQGALWRPLAAGAAAVVFGFAVGVMQPHPEPEILADELSLLAFGELPELPYED